ncbi:MAG TPA: c-type cytochrome [Candidatus Margulisiibacteriota bacterium]|nr:c-type cytochrome [Candidatus Margulisiibacteriota bacterium]
MGAICGWRVRYLTAVPFLVAAASGVAYSFTQPQADSGARIYKHQCARCHGDSGEGKDDSFKGLRAPELIGATALPCLPRPFQKIRQHAFRTVKDIYDFVSATMPADQPASLEAEQYWDVIAYVLQANGKPPDNIRISAASSAQIVLHADCTAGMQEARP